MPYKTLTPSRRPTWQSQVRTYPISELLSVWLLSRLVLSDNAWLAAEADLEIKSRRKKGELYD